MGEPGSSIWSTSRPRRIEIHSTALAEPLRGARYPVVLHRIKQPRSVRSFSNSTRVANATSTTPPRPKKRGFFRTVTLYSTGFLVLFYAASPLVAANNERFNVIFTENVPFGEKIMSVIEEQGLDDKLRLDFLKTGADKMQEVFNRVSKSAGSGPPAADKVEKAKEAAVEKVSSAKVSSAENAREKVREAKERARGVVEELKTKTEKDAAKMSERISEAVTSAEEKAKDLTKRPAAFSEGVEELVLRAEAALTGKSLGDLPEATTTTQQPVPTPFDLLPKDNKTPEASPKELIPSDNNENVYPRELPVGFEPPPGYKRPKPPVSPPSKPATESKKEDVLPLVAPAIASIAASEPVISELASTIDSLANFVKDNPAAASSAKPILETAKTDLQELATRIEQARSEGRAKLEAQLDEQAREYTLKLLELEMASQDKLDEQEVEFKHFFEDERRKLTQAYREKLEHELRTQSEIINERLKAEVIAQGIELQRRWIREIKMRVEEERGGRLAKLDEIVTNLKQLERITLDNAEYLDENIRLHATWAALRALVAASAEASVRRPFRDELRALRYSSGAKEDGLMRAVLDSLEQTDVPDVGIEPLGDLTTWFATSVAPQVRRVALVPEYDAGVLSHLASHLLSSFRFARRGLVEGDDVLSVLARAEYYLNEKDLDMAARELSQLKGAPRVLLSDWLDAARKRLEVLQALEVVQAQTTLASLRVV
ncbi:MIC60 [Sanghuangporus vaninii]